MNASRLVVGAGMFGLQAALVLARRGHSVVVVDAGPAPITRASYVNQARVHTGMHYPRSLLTARDALRAYSRFRQRFEPAVMDFRHIYAVSEWGSKTSGRAFAAHAERLGLPIERIDVNRYFRPGTVADAYVVEEPTFDAGMIRQILAQELSDQPGISLKYGVSVTALDPSASSVDVVLSDGSRITVEGVVLAAYAGLNGLRNQLGIAPLPLKFELAEVVLGRFPADLNSMGITVMDGAFWSYMPFGRTGLVSLTNVGLTPLMQSDREPRFACQGIRTGCSPDRLDDCNQCTVRPASLWKHQVQQMSRHLPRAHEFVFERSLLTTKVILRTSELDDARPTVLRREPDIPVWTVLSGKVSTLFELEELE